MNIPVAFHTCPACARTFTRAEWLALAFVGVDVVDFEDDGSTEVQESRNCPCGSTAIRIAGSIDRTDGVIVSFGGQDDPILYDHASVEFLPAYLELLDALRATAARCMELRKENRRLRKLVGNSEYGKSEIREINFVSAYPMKDPVVLLRARAQELRDFANTCPKTEGAFRSLKAAEELGRLANIVAKDRGEEAS